MSRREQCACGGELYAPDGRDWFAIPTMVLRHNRSEAHIAWQLRRGW